MRNEPSTNQTSASADLFRQNATNRILIINHKGVDDQKSRKARSLLPLRISNARAQNACTALKPCADLERYRGLDWKRRASMTEVPTMVRTEMR
jgi:hypothetical protein